MLSPKQLEQRQKAGLALRDQRGPDYYSTIGKKGGRPTFNQWLESARKRERASQQRSRPGRRKENADC